MTRIEAAGIINAIKCSMVTTLKEHEALTMAECVLFEAEPIRRGRWKGAGMGDYMCSWCATVVSGNRYHYCPNCGARMDEVKE